MTKVTSSTTVGALSAVEYLALAIDAGKNLRALNIPLPMNVAQDLLVLLRPGHNPDPNYPKPLPPPNPPPIPATILTPAEVSARTQADPAWLRSRPVDRPGYIGIWKKARVPATSERKALKAAGRNWHSGM